MLAIAAPHGPMIRIPSTPTEDEIRYPSPGDAAALRAYYEDEGYVVIRGCISGAVCDELRRAFEAEVKPFRGFIYRQASAEPERHVFTAHGYMLNSILNLHAVDPRAFPSFRRLGTDLITASELQSAVRALLGESGTVVQSMYFEGNPSTWAHQDTYYLDSEQLGRMTAAWIALEDIAPGAGRFFVYPRSHKVELAENRAELNIASNHSVYKNLVVETLRRQGFECRAPALRKGDALFWNSRTIHGSLETREPHYSRSSVTAHYIPSSTRFMQYQARIKQLSLQWANSVPVHTPKDLGRPLNRAILKLETSFPRAFNAVKRTAIRVVTR